MILHVDMDAFYASVEERERPELAGRPVIVAGSPQGRGVVSAANYAVRKFGVHSAIPTSTALRLCPQVIVIPPRHDLYARISDQIREILLRYTPLVEPLSLDEAFLDVGGCEGLFGSAIEIGRRIKREIRTELRLTASVGIAPNKFLAKIASDLQKPDGFVVVEPDRVQEFLDPLPVGRLWGVGRVTGALFETLGLRTIADVRRLPPGELRRRLGEWGDQIEQLARGIDSRSVIPDREARSISHETTFAVDLHDRAVLRSWLRELTEHVGSRLRRHHLKGRTVHIKVRFADFQTITRALTLAEPTDITDEIWSAAAGLLQDRVPPRRRVRLIGVGVSGFEAAGQAQRSLFPDPDRERHSQLDAAADQIRKRFGAAALNRGSGLLHETKHKPLPRPEALP